MNNSTKNLIPHIVAIVIMLLVTMVFFSPDVFDGLSLSQHDVAQAKGSQGEIMDYHEKGDRILWTNSQFGGMPVYQIWVKNSNFLSYPVKYLLLNQGVSSPFAGCFLGVLSCYLLLCVLRVDWRLAIGGALTYGLSTYNMDLLQAGHVSKLLVMDFLPSLLAGLILAFRKRYFLGATLFGFSLGAQIYANHFQITYYSGMIVAIAILVYFIPEFIKDKEKRDFSVIGKIIGVIVLASALAVSSNLSKLWTTSEYSSETQRGKTELASKKQKDGLSTDYAFSYSLGMAEAFVPSMVQNYYGGGNQQNSVENTKLYQRVGSRLEQQLASQGMTSQEAGLKAKSYLASIVYRGNDFTPGAAIYFGILIWFFAILAVFLSKGKDKWWLLVAGIFMMCISMGDAFFLNHIFFDSLPLYNKFRALSMAMGLSHLCFIALALLGGKAIFSKEYTKEQKQKALYIAGGTLLGLLVLLFLGGNGDLSYASKDAQAAQSLGADGVAMVKDARASLMKTDILKSFILVLLAGGFTWLYLNKGLKALYVVIAISVLMLGDMYHASKRIMNKERFFEKGEIVQEEEKQSVDEKILADTDLHYRVLDLRGGNPFSDSKASFWHKSLGGYHSAKLMIFEEFKNNILTEGGRSIRQVPKIWGMMNVKYIIENDNEFKINPANAGDAWFVRDIKRVDSADKELSSLRSINPKETAVVQNKFDGYLSGFSLKQDSTASIKMTSYHPDVMTYEYSTNVEQFALFSEMYYNPDKGWNAYLNGEKIDPFIKANYVLRGMRLPAGQKQVLEMKFEPKSFYIGDKFSMFGSIILILAFLGAIILYFMKNGLTDPNHLHEEEVEVKKPTNATVSKVKKEDARRKNKRKR